MRVSGPVTGRGRRRAPSTVGTSVRAVHRTALATAAVGASCLTVAALSGGRAGADDGTWVGGTAQATATAIALHPTTGGLGCSDRLVPRDRRRHHPPLGSPHRLTPGTMTAMERHQVEHWVAGYEKAWRTPGTASLAKLFTPEIAYVPSPWAPPVVGLDALGEFWEAQRAGPEEEFTLRTELVALEGRTAVVRAAVDYGDQGDRWRDLWLLRFGTGGRCAVFEEWPFAPGPDPS